MSAFSGAATVRSISNAIATAVKMNLLVAFLTNPVSAGETAGFIT
jgi:hypothetical protein